MQSSANGTPNLDITKQLFKLLPIDDNLTPSEFINTYWSLYTTNFPSNNSMNGTIFENLIVLALGRAGIQNIYVQTELTYVPSAIFDVFLYHHTSSFALSIKTTLRERWKQADLEALAIKQVHKNIRCYVVTLSANEVNTRRKNDTSYAGLDGFIIANNEEFDILVEHLSQVEFEIAGTVPIIKTENKRYDKKKFLEKFDMNF